MEQRHRWTRAERTRMLEAAQTSGPPETVAQAANRIWCTGVFPGLGEHAVYAQLYDLYLRGLTPWLTTGREDRAEFSAAMRRALREVVRVMRVEVVSDILVSLTPGGAKVQLVRRTETIDLEVE